MKTLLPGINKVEWMYAKDLSYSPSQLLNYSSKIHLNIGEDRIYPIQILGPASVEETCSVSVLGEFFETKLTFESSEDIILSDVKGFKAFIITTVMRDRFLIGDTDHPYPSITRILINSTNDGVRYKYEVLYKNKHGIIALI